MLDWRVAETEKRFTRLKRPAGNPAGRKTKYVKEVGAFDIETSTITDAEGDPHSFMYVWMYTIDDRTYYGRGWDEFRAFLRILRRKIPEGYTLLTYVFNLSYEYQFLAGVFDFQLDDIFATEPRKILKLKLCEWVELRCAYFLTNMSLRKFLQTEGVETQKGEMDYKKIRFPWTPLTEDELGYCEADVLGLTQAVRSRAHRSSDNWYTIPYTSTGYVRREAKKVMRQERRHDDYTYDSWEVYRMLIKAFRGGNTHASRYWAAYGVIDDRVGSRDFSSHYPNQICGKPFPSQMFFTVPRQVYINGSINYVESLMQRNYAVLFRIRMTDAEVREKQHVPYIPFDKCEICHGGGLDNGRILFADEIQMVITDVDWRIIKSMYTWSSCEATWIAYSQYAPLPEGYIALTREYYRRKTELKGVDDYAYRRSKELLNSLYGMMAQAVLRMEIKMDDHGVLYEKEPEDMRSEYEKNAKKCFMPYAWGVWLTAWARYDLQKAIDALGDRFVYCDTDSVKYISDGCDVDFDAMFQGDDFIAYDKHGAPHRMGVMEADASYSKFVTLGAKKYAVVYADSGKMEITVAGVGKMEGSAELKEKGGLTAFKPGLIFKSGGIDAVYNDMDNYSIDIGPKHLSVTRNVSLVEGEYTLGVTDTYQELLDEIVNGRRIIDPFSI